MRVRAYKRYLLLALLKLILLLVDQRQRIEQKREQNATQQKTAHDVGDALLALIVIKALHWVEHWKEADWNARPDNSRRLHVAERLDATLDPEHMRARKSYRSRLPAYKRVCDKQIPKFVHVRWIFELASEKAQDGQSD